MEFLYGNIGSKIKGLAVVTAILGAIGAFVGGILLTTVDDDLIAVGICTMLLGPIASWISSWVLYGFGEIVSKLDNIDYYTRKAAGTGSSVRQTTTAPQTYARPQQDEMVIDYCPECNTKLRYNKRAKFVSCPSCGCTLEVSK